MITTADLDGLILEEADRRGSVSVKKLVAASGFLRAAVGARVRSMILRGELEATEPARSPRRRYRRPAPPSSSSS